MLIHVIKRVQNRTLSQLFVLIQVHLICSAYLSKGGGFGMKVWAAVNRGSSYPQRSSLTVLVTQGLYPKVEGTPQLRAFLTGCHQP